MNNRNIITGAEHFREYVKHCQKIESAFAHLPDFNASAIFATWELGGLFSFDNHKGQFWINVVAHMSVAAVLGLKLAERFSKELSLENLTPKDIAETLLIHDWSKRLEDEYKLKNNKGEMEEVYKKRRKFLARENNKLRALFPKKIIVLIAATGDEGVMLRENRPMTLGEEIIFYADCCTSDSVITRWADRFDALASAFEPGGRYEHANEYFFKRYRMSHRKKYESILLPIEAKISDCLDIRPQDELPLSLVPNMFQK